MIQKIAHIKAVKQTNSSAILKLIKKEKFISRADISKKTGLTRSTVSSIVSYLIELGYVTEIGEGESSGGKKPILIGIKKNSAYAIGIDLANVSHIRGVLCNLNGDIVLRKEIPYKNYFPDILEKTILIIKGLISGVPSHRVKGIGVSASGIVDSQKQEILRSSYFDTSGRNLVPQLTDRFAFPFLLENDAHAAALAEKQLGVGAAFDNLLYFNIERGIGLGIIIDGKIYYGGFGGPGEIGRMIIYPEPEKIDYSSSYYLENRLSEQSIVESVLQLKGTPIPYRKIIRMYLDGDEEIRRLFDRFAANLAYAVAITSNVLNPEAIVLGGRINEFGERFFDYFKNCLHHFLEPQFVDKTKVYLSKIGPDAPALGGAVAVINKIFDLEL